MSWTDRGATTGPITCCRNRVGIVIRGGGLLDHKVTFFRRLSAQGSCIRETAPG
jgi:hypothetical protein